MKKNHPNSSLRNCPYWLAKSRKCLISRQGLFIPLESHISNYCTTLRHTHCRLYVDELFVQQSSSRVSKLNRRKYNRFPSGHQLTLQQVTGANSRRMASLKTVYTTNESVGGLQIRTQSPLFNGSLVSFSYKSPVDSAKQRKLARVMWCRYQKDTLVYLAGLSFQKDGKSDDTSAKTG